VNHSTASPEHLDVVIGFNTGDLVWLGKSLRFFYFVLRSQLNMSRSYSVPLCTAEQTGTLLSSPYLYAPARILIRIIGIHIKFSVHRCPMGSILVNTFSGITPRRYDHCIRQRTRRRLFHTARSYLVCPAKCGGK
jgi:hypothetical protein